VQCFYRRYFCTNKCSSLPTADRPKNFICALCSQFAFDAYKLICCNKIICSGCTYTIPVPIRERKARANTIPGQANFQFPTTCPSCDHSPLEADSVTPDKNKRHTLRVWLQKQKKKDEAKAAAQAATPPVEVTPAAPEVQPVGDGAEQPVESVEETPKAEDGPAEEATAGSAETAGDAEEHAGSASAQPNEVGFRCCSLLSHVDILSSFEKKHQRADENECLKAMKNIAVTRANDHGVLSASPFAVADPVQDTTSEIKTDRRGSTASQNVTKSVEPSGAEGATDEKNNTNGANGSTMGGNPMMNGMPGQVGYGFPNQAGFNNGMGWNGMPNMMANGAYGMNPMGMSPYWTSSTKQSANIHPDFNNMNGMYGGFGGNMGMNDMSAMNMMQYGGGYGNNGWNGMGGGYGNYGGPNQQGGYNQSGAYPEMMNQFPKNNFPNQNQNRFHGNQGGAYPQRNNRNGSQGGYGPGSQNAYGRPGSHSGPPQNVRRFHQQFPPRPFSPVGNPSISATDESVPTQRDGQSPDGNANSAPEAKAEGEQAKASAEPTDEGKENVEGATASTDPQAVQDGGVALDITNQAENGVAEAMQDGGLKPIQTVDTGDADMQDYDQSTMGDGMQANMPYTQGMMNQFPDQAHQMGQSYDPNMNMDMGYNGYNRVGRGNFREGAYGAATVLAGGQDEPTEPIGVGVVGAPTGPRAMREGRPNTGFSSRVNSARFPPPPKSVASSIHDAAPGSPQRRVRS
jgi:hypothetical protein